MKRAERRHHFHRMKARALRHFRINNPPELWGTELERRSLWNADHMAVCSDPWCCGNPRHFDGQSTVQEMKYEHRNLAEE